MKTFVDLVRELFLLSQGEIRERGPARGYAWERRIAEYVVSECLPVESLPGGFRVFGHMSMSGLSHQIDASFDCADALVIGEWKAHVNEIPKNEILRFKAVTDDFFMAMGNARPKRPIMRVFGGKGHVSEPLRSYAVLHGITLIEPYRWPTPVLASDDLIWPDLRIQGPVKEDRDRLGMFSRSLQEVLVPQSGGNYLLPRPWNTARISAALKVHDFWSDRLWESIDGRPGLFEEMVDNVLRKVSVSA